MSLERPRGIRSFRLVAAVWVAVALVGCARAPAVVVVPAPPSPVPDPEARLYATAVEGLAGVSVDFVLTEPAEWVPDEILRSSVSRDEDFQREVERWVDFWRTRARRSFPESMDRMTSFEAAVDSTLSRKGLPPSLRFLPIIESGYSPVAVSPARAVGIWQFMEPTARVFGMGISPLVDERRDPLKSTEAAAEYLGQLRSRFGSWFMALAAYNAGPGRVQRILDQHAPLRPPSDSLLWSLREHLPRETREYIPKFFAAALVAGNPEAHGFPLPVPSRPFTFDEVTVPDATTLDVIAQAAEAPLDEIRRLNPELVRGMTPPGRETTLRVPRGHGDTFRERFALIPPSERVTTVEHRIASGETLSGIARRYRVALSDLQAANPGLNPRALRIGRVLIVPVAPGLRAR